MKNALQAWMVVLLCAVPVVAGPQEVPAKTGPTPAPTQAPRPTTTAEAVNIRYEIRIREEGPGIKPTVKTVTMVGTIQEVSLVRAQGQANNPLNVDITPTGLRDMKVRTKFGIEYTPMPADAPAPAGPVTFPPQPRFSIRQTVHAWLDSGKPMVISESADPNSDRRFVIEVTATILR